MLSNTRRSDARQSPDLRSALRKRQILDGARYVFFLNGYVDTSVEAITVQAGVSKGSIYHYFDSKDALFTSLIKAEAERIARVMPVPDPDDLNPASNLRQIGTAILDAFDTPATIATLRLIIGALGRFPHLGKEFLRDSLGPTVERITVHLDACSAAGTLRIANSRTLAEQFAKRCLAQAMERVLVPDQPRQTEAEGSIRVGEVLRGLGLSSGEDA